MITRRVIGLSFLIAFMSNGAFAELACEDAGPQTPRDIGNVTGENRLAFPLAPDYRRMNLCNIHTHTNAEHKGPGFTHYVGGGKHGGYACNETSELTAAERRDPFEGQGAYKGVKPGDTIEVHWVHTTCNARPGQGLGSCFTPVSRPRLRAFYKRKNSCDAPKLRVEAQVFLLVNDPNALDFNDYVYRKKRRGKFHQAKAIPSDTGQPVVFRGSTTGPKYNQKTCSPAKVTWSVPPQCAKLNIASLHRWAEKRNIFEEDHSHGVRQLVTDPALLAPIEE